MANSGANLHPGFPQRLLNWWDQHGRKGLPWQQPRTPYRVWVSEIMLQQTQVSTVIPYFERWISRFPELEQLAEAPLDDVLEHWAGLGYYARARNLHKTAVLCMEQHEGQLPVTADGLCTLPGIGLSTANAIVSQSSDKPAAVLDGNVRRVLARHALVEEWPGSGKGQQLLWEIAELRLPTSRGADYTQAIMDLGAMVCLRSNPLCEQCPVRQNCRALADNAVHRLPVAKPPTKVSKKNLYWLVVIDDQCRILLEQRPPAGIWGGLWSLPEAASIAELEQQSGLDLAASQALQPRKHRLSHIAMSIHPILVRSIESRRVKCQPEQQWFKLDSKALPGVPKPAAELIKQLHQSESE